MVVQTENNMSEFLGTIEPRVAATVTEQWEFAIKINVLETKPPQSQLNKRQLTPVGGLQ